MQVRGYDCVGCSTHRPENGGRRSAYVRGTVKEVMEYFGYRSAAAFAVDWKKCTPTDKAQLKAGLADGSLTY